MESFAYRLKEAMEKRRVKPADLCRATGISKSLMSQYMSGACMPKQANTRALAAALFVSEAWLLTGEGPMERAVPHGAGELVRIPVYGEIAAGLPILAEQCIIDDEYISAEMAADGEYYALQVKGDSMEPRLFSGDVVILRKTEEFVPGAICAVMVNGEEATLKKVLLRKNGLTLLPLNPAYAPLNFDREQVKSLPVRCLGAAVEVRGKI